MTNPNYSQAEAGLPQGGNEVENCFSNKAIRQRFVQKVYAILAAQFLVTVAICALFMFVEGIKHYIQNNIWPLITAMVVYLVIGIMIICCRQLQRTVPWNYILLFSLTVAMSIMVGTICAFTDYSAVLIAAVATCGATLVVSLFSCWTKFDFTKLIWIAFICGLVITFTGLFMIPYHDRASQVLYGGAGALVMMLYLAIDTQLIMGGRRFELSEEDYIFGALMLYLDIVNLFLFILRMVRS